MHDIRKYKTTTLKFSHLFSAKAMLYSFFNSFIVSDLNLSLERQLFTAYSAQLVDKRSECNFCLQEWNNLNLALSRKVTKGTEASSFPLHETWKKKFASWNLDTQEAKTGWGGGGGRQGASSKCYQPNLQHTPTPHRLKIFLTVLVWNE